MKKLIKAMTITLLLAATLLALVSCSSKTYTLTYIAGEGGSIDGEAVQTIESGKNGTEVTAAADYGYIFTHWSDGQTNQTRQDKNVQKNMTFTAAFAKLDGSVELEVTYKAGEGGYIDEGETHTVLYGQSLTVTAIAEEGYQFVKWSDGILDAQRTDNNIKAGFTVTAIFKKVQELTYIDIQYMAGEGGYIDEGETHTVLYGQSLTATAIAEEGYQFVKWSDGILDAQRTDENIKVGFTVTAIFAELQQPVYIEVKYIAGEGGYIDEGETHTILYGQSITVTAIAEEGYEFVKWSDEIETAQRTDEDITSEFTVLAIFRVITKTLTYVYNRATDNNTQTSTVLNYKALHNTSIITPIREYFTFDGWYLDADFLTQVTDENANLVIGHEIFDAESNCLYAKWSVIEEITFKMLLVFVTEIKATLYTIDGIGINIDYKMSEEEKRACEEISDLFKTTLSETFDGLVKFEVDTYFTTDVVTEKSFTYQYTIPTKRDYRIYAEDIPELWSQLKNYRSVIVGYSANDHPEHLLNVSGGVAHQKSASVHLDEMFNILGADSYYPSILKITLYKYLHEFTHTVELGLNVYGYHDFIYQNAVDTIANAIENTKLYLLNQAIVDGEKVGIPYYFWKGEISVPVEYTAGSGGYINGKQFLLLYVPYGEDAEEVTAVPSAGYRFVSWSDGVLTPTRQDTIIISYLSVRAVFEEDGSPKDPQIFLFTQLSDNTCSVRLIDKTLTTVYVPRVADFGGFEYTVTEIAGNGFSSCPNLKYVYLPDTIIKIGNTAFQNCVELELIDMPFVEHIGTQAFSRCPKLTDLIIPQTVKTVGATILRNNATKVHIRPNTDTSEWALNWNESNSITEVDYDSDFEWSA